MRFKSNKRQTETFLVLPLLEQSSNNNKNLIMPKNPGLKLFTKTWNPKRTKKDDDKSRPLTATLEKPTILDISFLGVIDMSTMTKEFLNITNLCRLPLPKTIKKKNSTSMYSAPPSRPLSLPGCKPTVIVSDEESARSSGKIASSTSTSKGNKNIKTLKEKRQNIYDRGETLMKMTVSMTRQGMDSNNNRMKHSSRRAPGKLLDRVKTPLSVGKMSSLPEPCTTCGRPNHPERLHSHPPTPVPKPRGKESTPPPRAPVKSSVQRPMAIKYKSRQLETSSSNPQQRVTPLQSSSSVPGSGGGDAPADVPKSAGKRTLTCYLCGREFGTASLAIHQPKCLQKWHRENANLPPHLRRQLPPKPDPNLTREEWDKFAWESSQKNLVPCSNCGRTFYPESLIVHQRSCKSLNDLGAVNELYKEVFPKSPPARSAVQVARLPMNANVEIEAIAGVPQSCSCGPITPSQHKPSCNL